MPHDAASPSAPTASSSVVLAFRPSSATAVPAIVGAKARSLKRTSVSVRASSVACPYSNRSRSSGTRVLLDDRALGTADGVRPLELDRRGPALDQRNLLHDETEVLPRLLHRDVADLAAARRVPAEELVRGRRVPRADRVLDVRVGSRLAELVIEGRADALPRLVERDDPVRAFGVHADCVVHGLGLRTVLRVDGAVIPAEAVPRVRRLVLLAEREVRRIVVIVVVALLMRALVAVDEDDSAREHEAEDGRREVEPGERILRVE